MLFIFCSIILFFLVFFGWGKLTRIFFEHKRIVENPVLLFFLGYSALIIPLSYLSFFRKFDTPVLLLVLLFGLLSLFFISRKKTKLLAIDFSRKQIFLLVFVLSLLLLTISTSLGGQKFPKAGDTTGYHMGIVSWLNHYPLVPGLANLHFRLGSHSGYLQLAGVFDNAIWDNQSPFVMPGLFFFAFGAYFIWEVFLALTEKEREKKKRLVIWRIFYATPLLVASIVYHFGTYNSAPNLYYDLLPMFLSAILVNEIVKYFLSGEADEKNTLLEFLFIINLLSAAAYLSKQNAAAVVLMVAIFSLYLLARNKLLSWKNLVKLFFLPALGFLGSVIANLITSGYPLFPLPFLRVNFPWTAPESTILSAYDSIKYWARLPGRNFMSVADNSFLYWFLPWVKRNLADRLFLSMALVPFGSGLIFWVVNFFWNFKKRQKYHWLFLAQLLNLVYWFFSAPDIRFSLLFFIMFFASSLAIFALFLSDIYATIAKRVLDNYAFHFLIFFVLAISATLFMATSPIERINKKPKNVFYVTFVDSNQFYEKEMKTRDGKIITVYQPKNDNECRSLPLPCTFYYSPEVKAFDSQNLGAGFYFEKAQ